MQACGLGPDTSIMNETEFYVSHECLLMEYEQALTREDSTTGLWCATATDLGGCCGAYHSGFTKRPSTIGGHHVG